MLKFIKAVFLTISAVILLFVITCTVLLVYDSVSDRIPYYIEGGWFGDRELRRTCNRHITEAERKSRGCY